MLPGRVEKKAPYQLGRKSKPANTPPISTTSNTERSIFLLDREATHRGQGSPANCSSTVSVAKGWSGSMIFLSFRLVAMSDAQTVKYTREQVADHTRFPRLYA